MLLLQKKPQQNEIDKKVSLEARIDSSVSQKIVQFNSFKKVMADRKDLIEQDFVSFCLEIETKRSKLENEVNILEERRKEAVKPLDNERNALLEAKNDNLRAIKELDDKILVLNEKIADLSSLEALLKSERKDLEDDKKTFSKIKNNIKKETDNLLTEKQSFDIERQEFDSLMFNSRKDLDEKVKKVKEKELALNILLEENKKRATELDTREKRIENRQLILKKAMDEFNNKKV